MKIRNLYMSLEYLISTSENVTLKIKNQIRLEIYICIKFLKENENNNS